VQRLLDCFGSLAVAWRATAPDLLRAGLDQRTVQALERTRATLEPERELARARAAGLTVLTRQDADYPARLAAISRPPPLLYVRGALTPADEWALAVVGTRRQRSMARRGRAVLR
jgi:DNA processing protein